MSSNNDNNKRIARNTILLYIRMLLTMGVSLYTSRIILKALGVEDFGIYNVVGGVVAMFSILSASLSASISRFITYELGCNQGNRLNIIFSTSVTIQIILACIILIFAESIGLWFLNYKMNLPTIRMDAANWVYQLSILTFIINLLSIPYNASIIAHERMGVFAYISILEASGKLIVAFLIISSPFDKLIFYATMICTVAVVVRIVYTYYCKKKFSECTYRFILDKQLISQMFRFAGWNFIGATSNILRDQGGNIILNLFYGPTLNAAKGIASQVNNAIQGFANSFMTALDPQITKSYAAKNQSYMLSLIYQGSRFAFYLLFFMSLPLLINTHYILYLWLGDIPNHSALFVQLTLVFILCESISQPLITAMLATGNIRNYQIIVGGLQMLNLPLSYLALKQGATPEAILIIAIIISQFCLVTRLLLLRKMIGLSMREFIRRVYINIIQVGICAAVIPSLIATRLPESFVSFILSSFCAFICTFSSVYYIGCNKKERELVKNKVSQLRYKFTRK